VFGITPSLRNRKRWYEAYYCSKIVYRFYSRILGHRTGKKTGSLKIPDSFRHDSRLLLGFLKGLFTAEGSIKVERNIRIALEMQERLLMRETASILKDATFHPHLYSYARNGRRVYGLYIYGLDEARRFHRMIGFVGRKGLRLSKVISQLERRGL
jgi:intein/homing endonuclease